MTIKKIIEVYCNLCGAQLEIPGDQEPPDSVVDARRLAHLAGWLHDRIGRDVCPHCRTFPAPKRPGKIHIPIPHWR